MQTSQGKVVNYRFQPDFHHSPRFLLDQYLDEYLGAVTLNIYFWGEFTLSSVCFLWHLMIFSELVHSNPSCSLLKTGSIFRIVFWTLLLSAIGCIQLVPKYISKVKLKRGQSPNVFLEKSYQEKIGAVVEIFLFLISFWAWPIDFSELLACSLLCFGLDLHVVVKKLDIWDVVEFGSCHTLSPPLSITFTIGFHLRDWKIPRASHFT